MNSAGTVTTERPVSDGSDHSHVVSNCLGKAVKKWLCRALQCQGGTTVKQSTWKAKILVFKWSPSRNMIIVIGWFFQNGLLKGQGFNLAGVRTACGSHNRQSMQLLAQFKVFLISFPSKGPAQTSPQTLFQLWAPKGTLCRYSDLERVMCWQPEQTRLLSANHVFSTKPSFHMFHLSAITTLPNCSCFSPTSDVLSQRMRHFWKAYQTTLVESLVWQLLQRRKWIKWAAR